MQYIPVTKGINVIEGQFVHVHPNSPFPSCTYFTDSMQVSSLEADSGLECQSIFHVTCCLIPVFTTVR